MRVREYIVLSAALAVGICCLAQQTTKKDGKAAKTEQKKEQAAAMPIPKPSPEIEKLAKTMVGTWKVSGKILDEHWAPGGATGSGTEIVRRGPGGFSVISDSKMTWQKLGPMQGHGVCSWDPGKKALTGLWCDNWAPMCESMGEGKWEGDNLVYNADMDMGNGQKVPTRMTYNNFTPNGFDWKMEISDGKGGWNPEMTLKYEKPGAAAPKTEKKPSM